MRQAAGQPLVSVSKEGQGGTIDLVSDDRSTRITMTFEMCTPSWWKYVVIYDDDNSDTGVSVRHRDNMVFLGRRDAFGITVSDAVWRDICNAMIRNG